MGTMSQYQATIYIRYRFEYFSPSENQRRKKQEILAKFNGRNATVE